MRRDLASGKLTNTMSRELSERQNTLLGVCAAFVESIILQPTLYFKNAAARGLPFTLNPAVFYRGTGASIINECQMMAVQFGITSALQKQFALRSEARYAPLPSYLDALR